MKRASSSFVWVVLGVTTAIYAVTWAASRRFPPAPAEPTSVELRAWLDSLKGFDAAALEQIRQRHAKAEAAALSASRAFEIQEQLVPAWETTALLHQPVRDLTIIQFTLKRSGDWNQLLGAVREVQQISGVSISAVSASARNGVLSVELHVKIVAHTQPVDDKASGLPVVVHSPQIR
jgi:hypothetical protein